MSVQTQFNKISNKQMPLLNDMSEFIDYIHNQCSETTYYCNENGK